MENTIIEAIKNGHNCVILGQAGTGKTSLLKSIESALKNLNRSVKMTASTGMAAALVNGCTVHRFAGLHDGRYSDEVLTKKILYDSEYKELKETIRKTDCLIIDEISMLSRKIFFQVETIFRTVRGVNVAFGGMQVVLSGDFYQLKPVANMNYDDAGELIISDLRFKDIIPHRFVLTHVHRQTEEQLIRAVHELSQSLPCSTETINLLKSLERPLSGDTLPDKLFALNFDVAKCNSDSLLEMEGKATVYTSADQGDTRALLGCQAKQKLHLKIGAPVILIVNLSDRLVNGLKGVVREMLHEGVKVQFEGNQNLVYITHFMFTVFRPNLGKNVAYRKQLPLHLAFALTTHKAQGTTLERLEVDCSNMTRPGQIGVAIGRARSSEGLRVKNFKPSLVHPQPQIITDFYNSESHLILDSLVCCKPEHASQSCPSSCIIEHIIPELATESSDCDHIGSENDSDNENESYMIQVIDTIERDEEEILNVNLPPALQVDVLLDNIQYTTPFTPEQIDINDQVHLLRVGKDITCLFVKKLYWRLKRVCEENVTGANVSNRNFTMFYSSVAHFITTDDYKQFVDRLFLCGELKMVHYRVAFDILQAVRAEIIAGKTDPIKKAAVESAKVVRKPFKGSESGRGKLRYCAGWCVATIRYKKKQEVQRNLYSNSARQYVNQTYSEIKLLDDLTESESVLLETSIDKPSLVETQRKNLRGGLCNITDKAFDFFQNLDSGIRSLETSENINLHAKNFYKYITNSILSDEMLHKQWTDLVSLDEVELYPQQQVQKVKEEIINKYIRMPSAHFRREFKRKLTVTKQEAHRKQIRMRKESRSTLSEPSTSASTSTNVPSTTSKSTTFEQQELDEQPKQTRKRKSSQQSGKVKGKGKRKRSKKVQWPCGKCEENCITDCVCCDICDVWHHYRCIGLFGDEAELEDEEWHCPECKNSLDENQD